MKPLITLGILCMAFAVQAQETPLKPVQKTTHLGVFWGYENANGETIIPAKYKMAYAFENGVARVQGSDERFGLINSQGEELLPTEYDAIDRFVETSHQNNTVRYEASVVRKSIRTEESKNRHKYYQPVSVPLPGERTKDFIHLAGVVNTRGDFIVPLAEHHIDRVKGLFLIGFARDEHRNYHCVIDQGGEVVIDPVLAKVDVHENNIALKYTRALSINGSDYKYDVVELYDREGNILVNADRGYDDISLSEGNAGFHLVERIFYSPDFSQKYGLVNAQGEEVLPTLYGWIDREHDTGLFKVIIEHARNGKEAVYFYVDESMNCIEKTHAPCPDPLGDDFDYESFLGVRKVRPDFRKTTSLPWKDFSNAGEESSDVSGEVAGTGHGPVYDDTNAKWVEYPPPAIGGHVIMLENVQSGTECGQYEWITSNTSGTKVEARASLECIHADPSGYIFKMNYSLRPDWYRHNPGARYLHVMKKSKKGKVKYKYQIMIGEYDKTFEKNKMGYTVIKPFDALSGGGFTGGWWEIAFEEL